EVGAGRRGRGGGQIGGERGQGDVEARAGRVRARRAQVVDVEQAYPCHHRERELLLAAARGQRLVARQTPHVGVEGGELERERARVRLVEQQEVDHRNELEAAEIAPAVGDRHVAHLEERLQQV